jgi:hypothetical protein
MDVMGAGWIQPFTMSKIMELPYNQNIHIKELMEPVIIIPAQIKLGQYLIVPT